MWRIHIDRCSLARTSKPHRLRGLAVLLSLLMVGSPISAVVGAEDRACDLDEKISLLILKTEFATALKLAEELHDLVQKSDSSNAYSRYCVNHLVAEL